MELTLNNDEHQNHNFALNIESSRALLVGDYLQAMSILQTMDTETLTVIAKRCKKLKTSRFSKKLSEVQRNSINSKINIISTIVKTRNSLLNSKKHN